MRKLIWSTIVMIAVAVPGARVWHIRPAAAAQDHVVKVDDSDRDQTQWKWVPEEVTAAVGDTVTWDMHQPDGKDAAISHTATADDGSWDSGYITPGSKWTHAFDKPGDIHYHCTA